MKVKELIVKLQNLDVDLQELDIVIHPCLHRYDVEYEPFNAQDVLNNKIPNITIGTSDAQHILEGDDAGFYSWDYYDDYDDEPDESKKVVVLSAPTFYRVIAEEDSL